MLAAWRNGGGQYSAINSRLMVVCLKFNLTGGRSDWVSIVCVYAPTFSSPHDVKNKFLFRCGNVLKLYSCLEKLF